MFPFLIGAVEVDLSSFITQLTGSITPADIITVLGQVKVNILNINAGVVDTEAQIQLKLSVENAELLQLTIDNLNKIQGIYNITRVIH